MKLHLVGGFLGSGKTTAITNASKLLKNKGILAGVITNDQGNYLVDSSFADALDIPTGEVNGGCFCCNYNDLDTQINNLLKNEQAKTIFAESVGSCTDLVATVLLPMLEKKSEEVEAVSFSVFADSALLLKFLQGKKLGFTDEVSYIFEKQIEEASILVVNKVDLLSQEELKEIVDLTSNVFKEKTVLFQNSLDLNSIAIWLKTIDSHTAGTDSKVLDIDYEAYGKGEADLAWLDEEVEIIGSDAYSVAMELIDRVYNGLNAQEINIGHLKFLVSNGSDAKKISFTATSDNNWKEDMAAMEGEKITLMLNARAQTSPENLRELVKTIIKQLSLIDGIEINEYCVSAFKPGFPDPTFRYAS